MIELHQWRIARLQNILRKSGKDAFIGSTADTFQYITGSYVMTQKLIPERLEFAVVPAEGDPWLVIANMEETQIKNESQVTDYQVYTELAQSPASVLADTLSDKGLSAATVAMELATLPTNTYTELSSSLPEMTITDGKAIRSRAAQIKHPDELAAIEHAARATITAIEDAFMSASIGDTERNVGTRITTSLDAAGLEEQFKVLASGARTVMAHPTARDDVRIASGDLMRFDGGGIYKGYFSDVARTAIVGDNAAAERLYEQLFAIHEKVISLCTVGSSTREVFDEYARLFKQAGLPFDGRLIGHSIGIELHELPIISRDSDTVIEENMVFCIEPRFTLNGQRMHLEDTIVVTGSGPRLLSTDALPSTPIRIR